ncbi:MAG: PHP domain-containing protein, partial [Oscillospiraceae bacterium]|nr:PHP domain-containing protein [Oscillospiraceae bacterium]
MGYKTIAEFFESYGSIDNKVIADGKILKLGFAKNNTEMAMAVQFSQVVSLCELKDFAEKLKKPLGITSAYIRPFYSPELFSEEALKEVVQELKRRIPVNGFLDNADFCIEGSTVNINLKNGGEALLRAAGIEVELPKIVRSWFNVGVNISFGGTLCVDVESVETERNHELEEKIASMPAPLPKPAEKEEKSPDATTYTLLGAPADIVPEATVVMGKKIQDLSLLSSLSSVPEEGSSVTVIGDVVSVDVRTSKDGQRNIISIILTDYNGSVALKIIELVKKAEAVLEAVKPGKTVVVNGLAVYDTFDKEINIKPKDISLVSRVKKVDEAPVKRVELHCHTNMSMADGITPAEDIVKQAASWGMKAIAITDHGVCQSFPAAMYEVDKIRKNGGDFKVIYGMEAYQVNDETSIVVGNDARRLDEEFIVFDLETTGLSAVNERIIEIGAVKVRNFEIVDKFNIFVDPERPIPAKIIELTGISDSMVAGAPKEAEALKQFIDFCGNNAFLVAHNASFDVSFIKAAVRRQKYDFTFSYLDTVAMARSMLPTLGKFTLDNVAKNLGVGEFNHHRACDDAAVCAEIYIRLSRRLLEEEERDVLANELNSVLTKTDINKLPSYHQIIIAKNKVGLKNLYKLVSYSNLKYYHKTPRIPKSELIKHREGLIIGSACEAGELFRAIFQGKPWDELCDIARFYDYLEIQPLANNMYMLREGSVSSVEQLKDFNRTIVKLGEQLG